MTDKELLYIRTIAEERSISKAAQKLFLTQPSLSQTVQRVEQTMGTRLFTRTSSGLVLTYAGERYCQTAHEILRIYNDLELEVSDINNLKKGRVTLGITAYLATTLLPRVLPVFRRQYPHIDLMVWEQTSQQLDRTLTTGQLDFALLHTSPAPEKPLGETVAFRPLRQDPFVLAVSPAHPLCATAVSVPGEEFPRVELTRFEREPFLLVTRGQRIRHVSDLILRKAEIAPQVALVTNSFETARRLAAQGMGVTFTPRQYLDIFPGQYPGAYFSLAPELTPYWTLGIAVPKGGYLSKAAQACMELFTTEISPIAMQK